MALPATTPRLVPVSATAAAASFAALPPKLFSSGPLPAGRGPWWIEECRCGLGCYFGAGRRGDLLVPITIKNVDILMIINQMGHAQNRGATP